MTTTAEPDTAARTVPSQAGPAASTPEQTAELVVRRLIAVVLYGKPRRAIAAYRSLTVLCKVYRETHARIVELSRTGRPAVAAAAVSALVEAKLAHRRYRDGRSPLLRL
jgi:hypothetical protein